jgi:hypothetical protein
MKKAFILSALVLAAVAIAAAGCKPSDDGEEIEIRLAPIHEVEVSIAESFPEQIFVYIKGGLADGCTTFNAVETERSGTTIDITVTTQRPRDAACIQVYSFFEQNVALGSQFTSGQTYTVNVNDVTRSFEYP